MVQEAAVLHSAITAYPSALPSLSQSYHQREEPSSGECFPLNLILWLREASETGRP